MPKADGSKVTVALHVHTLYSACSETRLEDISSYCRTAGVNVLGITDHDTISGALALKKVAPKLRTIIGEEILTHDGEIVGLFLKQEIEPGLSALETAQRIKEQGGLVYIPHPFDPMKVRRIKKRAVMEILDLIDIIEVFNAKTTFPIFNTVAARFAKLHGIIQAVGSDAHYLTAIGLCMNKMKDFITPEDFLNNLRDAELITQRSGPLRGWWVGIKNVLAGEGHKVRRFRD
jgi:predicted metal-dependent phosphoesterase TrpH